MTLLLGIIADDYTGATDIASTLAQQGMRVIQVIGIPRDDFDPGDAEAIVIALKSRTNPSAEAVDWSRRSLKWLRERGARQILFKYCSTFDSSARGNIGPVADALLSDLDKRFAFVCPAFPDNRRTVYQGYLFVGEQLLSESSMRDHPLTPMRDASLLRLLRAQTPHEVGLIPHQAVASGAGSIEDATDELIAGGARYGVVDALTNADLVAIGTVAIQHSLVTGGSAIAGGMAVALREAGLFSPSAVNTTAAPAGRSLLVAGSCSETTRRQVAAARQSWPEYRLDLDALAQQAVDIDAIVRWAIEQDPRHPVMIHSASTPQEVESIQASLGVEAAGALVEAALAEITRRLVEAGFSRLIVAGGETSGAVISALGIDALRIGAQIDPGVPWTTTLTTRPLALALKSGNFGQDDFFQRAFALLDQA